MEVFKLTIPEYLEELKAAPPARLVGLDIFAVIDHDNRKLRFLIDMPDNPTKAERSFIEWFTKELASGAGIDTGSYRYSQEKVSFVRDDSVNNEEMKKKVMQRLMANPEMLAELVRRLESNDITEDKIMEDKTPSAMPPEPDDDDRR